MRLTAIGLPKTRRFSTSKAALKRAFADVDDLSVHMGSLGRVFKFDSRCSHRPVLTGSVVASLSVSRAPTAILQIYPAPASSLGSAARAAFEQQTLPRMRRWLLEQLAKPTTAILGYEELVIEWTGSEFREHTLRFL
jgi:hypothetical protein